MLNNHGINFADLHTEEDSSKLCYENFPHYEGIKKVVKEEVMIVMITRDFAKLLTLLIPSTSNLLLLLYASNEELLNSLHSFFTETSQTLYAEVKIVLQYSWSFSSKILVSNDIHESSQYDSSPERQLLSIATELWSISTFTQSLVRIISDWSLSVSPTSPGSPLSPDGAADIAEHRDGSVGVIGQHRHKSQRKESGKADTELRGGPQELKALSYADVAAGRYPAAAARKPKVANPTTPIHSRGLVLADFMGPKYSKKRGQHRRRFVTQSDDTVGTPATVADRPKTRKRAPSSGGRGGGSTAAPDATSRPWRPSLPKSAPYTVFYSPNERQPSRCDNCSTAIFTSKVQQLEEAGRTYAERLAVGELQPDPAAIFFELLPHSERHDWWGPKMWKNQ